MDISVSKIIFVRTNMDTCHTCLGRHICPEHYKYVNISSFAVLDIQAVKVEFIMEFL